MKSAPRFWDRDTALAALRYEAQRLGRTPTDRDLRRSTRTCASLRTYHRESQELGRLAERRQFGAPPVPISRRDYAIKDDDE